MKNLIIPYGVISIDDKAFTYCTSLTSITIADSVTHIGNHAFANCSSLTSITILNSVTYIGKQAFANCTSLTSITISNNVTTIDEWAFYYCTSLTSITIPKSVTTIGRKAFSGCENLLLVRNEGIPPLTGDYIHSDFYSAFDYPRNMILQVPRKNIELYKNANEWKDFGVIEGFKHTKTRWWQIKWK